MKKFYALIALFFATLPALAHSADVTAESKHNSTGDWVLTFTNHTGIDARIVFDWSFDWRCGDAYSTWEHYEVHHQSIPLSRFSQNNVVVSRACSFGMVVRDENIEFDAYSAE